MASQMAQEAWSFVRGYGRQMDDHEWVSALEIGMITDLTAMCRLGFSKYDSPAMNGPS